MNPNAIRAVSSSRNTLQVISLSIRSLSSWTKKPPPQRNRIFREAALVYIVAGEKWLVSISIRVHRRFVLNLSHRDATGFVQFVDNAIVPTGLMTVSTQTDREARGRRFWKRTSVVLKHASTNLKTLPRQRLLSYFINHISNLDGEMAIP